MDRLTKLLLARPIDFKVYREAHAAGLTALLYALPWWVIILLASGLLGKLVVGSQR